MIQLKLTLDKRRIKKDNTYPLVYRIGANRKSFYLSTGASILEKFWDDKRQQIKLKSKELEMLASRLRSKEIQDCCPYRAFLVALEGVLSLQLAGAHCSR